MRKPSLTDLRRLPDIQSKEHFNFNVGATPGGATDRNLFLKCHSVQFPGIANEAFVVNLWGHQVKHRGKQNSTLQMNVVYYEDRAFNTTKALRAWHKAVVNPETGTSIGNKFSYAITGQLDFFDHTGRTAYQASVVNMFPESLDGYELSGDSSAPLLVAATFGYDFVQDGDLFTGLASNIGISVASDLLGVDLSGIGVTFPDALRNMQQQALGSAIGGGLDVLSGSLGGFV